MSRCLELFEDFCVVTEVEATDGASAGAVAGPPG
jgi:hypothetical protein